MQLGIDFGTTRTVVACVDRGNYPVVDFVDGSGDAVAWIPSVVAVRGDELRYGFEAIRVAEDPAYTFLPSFKRLLSRPDASPRQTVKVGGQVRSVSDFIDFTAVQGFLHDKIRYKLEDLMKCGCESEPLGDLLKKFELDETHTFRLFIKPFMDAQTWDEDRIDRCCTHVIRPDGKLDSFCRYYSGF